MRELSTAPVPAPRRGGSRVMCPMIDVAAIESGRKTAKTSIHDLTCDWNRRGRSPKILRAYRRHWRRHHGWPFVLGTHAILDEIRQFGKGGT